MEPTSDKTSVLIARVRLTTTGRPERVIETLNRLLHLNFPRENYEIDWSGDEAHLQPKRGVLRWIGIAEQQRKRAEKAEAELNRTMRYRENLIRELELAKSIWKERAEKAEAERDQARLGEVLEGHDIFEWRERAEKAEQKIAMLEAALDLATGGACHE